MPLFLTLLFISNSLYSQQVHNAVSVEELAEIETRIENFYSGSAEAMNRKIPKYHLRKNQFISPRANLNVSNPSETNPLIKSAGAKATESYRVYYCKNFLKKRFPELKCDQNESEWAPVKANDQVEDLVDTWMTDVEKDINNIPVSGKTNIQPWTDDYWRIRWGITSFRYSSYDSDNEFKTYKEAVNSYAQPAEWLTLLSNPITEIQKNVVLWSPAEKYDLMVGDTDFTLTNEQKKEGESSIGKDGNVESWMGICHGWAAAALVVDRPLKAMKITGPNQVMIDLYPNDIKALISLAWANGSYNSNFVGGRCDNKKPTTYPNGRLKQQECFDSNPATFHLALGNLIGKEKVPFAFDTSFDYEVWNQPITAYEFTYFNPMKPSEKSKNWEEVAANYNLRFKRKDRFQKPMTRSKGISKVVGVIATVTYLAEPETVPSHSPQAEEDNLQRETYTYDLELVEDGRGWVVAGGEWHENMHPDFLWTVKKGIFPSKPADDLKINFKGNELPSAELTKAAKKASQKAYPMCRVLETLVNQSSGQANYICQ